MQAKKTISPIIINTSSVGENDIYEAWRESFAPLFDATPREKKLSLKNTSIEVCQIDNCVMINNHFNPSIFRRNKARVAYYDNDSILFCLWLHGDVILDNAGNHIRVQKNGAFLIDMGETAEVIASTSNVLATVIPKAMFRQFDIDANALSGIYISANDPRFEMLRNTYLSTFHNASKIQTKYAPKISKGLIALLASLISDDTKCPQIDAVLRRSMLSSIVNYIEKNISDPRLSVKSLLRKFPMSRSSLYDIFEPLGGIAQFIRERRLQQCYKLLTNSIYANTPINLIARSQGFSNGSHFCKLFKNHYSLLPSELQELAQQDSLIAFSSDLAIKKEQKIAHIHNWLVTGQHPIR